MDDKIKDDVIKLLKNRPNHITILKISSETGIPRYWIYNLISGLLTKVRPDRISKLHDYLKCMVRHAF